MKNVIVLAILFSLLTPIFSQPPPVRIVEKGKDLLRKETRGVNQGKDILTRNITKPKKKFKQTTWGSTTRNSKIKTSVLKTNETTLQSTIIDKNNNNITVSKGSFQRRKPIRVKHKQSLINSKTNLTKKQKTILNKAKQGRGNFGIGKANRKEAEKLGKKWVGPNHTIASDKKTLVSKDKLRQYRPPTYKAKLDKVQANFESRDTAKGKWKNNGHLDIVD